MLQIAIRVGRVDPLQPGNLDSVHHRQLATHRGHGRQPVLVLLLADAQCLQSGQHGHGRRPSAFGRFCITAEFRRRDAVEIRLDVDIAGLQRGDRPGDILLGQDIDHLPGN